MKLGEHTIHKADDEPESTSFLRDEVAEAGGTPAAIFTTIWIESDVTNIR